MARMIDAGSLRDNITDIYGGSDRLIYLADVLSLIDAQPTLTPPNEPLTCTGCMYSPDCPSEIHCFGCARLYTDNYRRPPEGEEDA